jgi:hypothetical protein
VLVNLYVVRICGGPIGIEVLLVSRSLNVWAFRFAFIPLSAWNAQLLTPLRPHGTVLPTVCVLDPSGNTHASLTRSCANGPQQLHMLVDP